MSTAGPIISGLTHPVYPVNLICDLSAFCQCRTDETS